jgi:hypothetical protein
MKDCEAIREQTNTSYQLVEMKQRLEGIINDSERFKLRVKIQKKLIEFNEAQKKVKDLVTNIL